MNRTSRRTSTARPPRSSGDSRSRRRSTKGISALVAGLIGLAGFLIPTITKSNNAALNSTHRTSTSVIAANAKRTGSSQTPSASKSNRSDPRLRAIGFRSRSKFDAHFQKHGSEFGSISQAEYLALAQRLRDAPLSKTVIEATQKDGTVSRFDRSSGEFTAFDPDLTIRTFFKPNDGEDYFWRASKLNH